MFSDWTETGFAIQTEGPEKPELTIHNKAYCVMLKFDNVIDIENMYLYRAEINQGDFICLAEIEGDTYFDFSTGNNKVYKYFLRVVNNQESFADSDIMTGSCSFSGNTLAASSELGDIVKLKYGQDGIPKKAHQFQWWATVHSLTVENILYMNFQNFVMRAKVYHSL